MILSRQDIALTICSLFTIILYVVLYINQYTPPIFFLCSIVLIYFSAPPKYILHPKNILFGYYFIWYTIPVMYGTKYENYTFTDRAEVLAYCMLILTYIIAFITLHYTSKPRENIKYKVYFLKEINRINFKWIHISFVLVSLLACFLTMYLSPYGVSGWLSNPGESFQFREGSGLATILLIFSSGIALTTGGYFLLNTKKRGSKILLFLVYTALIAVYLICIIHRQRLINFYLLLFLVPVFFLKLSLKKGLYISSFIFISIFLSSYLRSSETTSDSETAIKFFLNYFDTYDALVTSIKHVEPEIMGTTFMGLRKFMVGMGYHPDMPQSISQWLTPIYYPGWSDRATVQFPIETEMYLNGYYFGLIPFLIIYFSLIGFVYRYAMETKLLGAIFVSLYLSLEIIGHLRGMFIDITDFYNYPIMIVSFILLNKIQVHNNILYKIQ